MSQQPEALRLAQFALDRQTHIGPRRPFKRDEDETHGAQWAWDTYDALAIELRRLHAVELEAIALRAQAERLQAAGQVVHVCPEKDSVCGDHADRWCRLCPKKLRGFPAYSPATPQPDPAPVAGDEREAFEAEMLKQGYGDVPRICGTGSPCEGEYANQYWEISWRIWQARAALAAQLPAEPAMVPLTHVQVQAEFDRHHAAFKARGWADDMPNDFTDFYLGAQFGITEFCRINGLTVGGSNGGGDK